MTTLNVKNLGKAYRTYRTEWHRFLNWFGISIRAKEEHWVLRNVSFEIGSGEAVGIVGQNGAGKSTLLKLITGSVQATEGSVDLHGRVSAILELGMGFNPELTGRQNVYHSAGLNGLTQEQVDRAIDDIEAFAEIGEYFDEPVRTYSSGMQMRVAFAVATAYRPEFLIVDEALSVGDAYFAHKSFGRIRDFQKQGTSLLIVSHDPASIQALCNRAILLDKGKVIQDGPPEDVMNFYNGLIAEKENKTLQIKANDKGLNQVISGTGEARVESIEVLTSEGLPMEYINVGQAVQFKVRIKAYSALDELVFGYMIKDRLGQPVFGTNTYQLGEVLTDVSEGSSYTLLFSFDANLGPGTYSVTTALHVSDTHVAKNFEWRDHAAMFTIMNIDRGQFVGVNWLPPKLSVEV